MVQSYERTHATVTVRCPPDSGTKNKENDEDNSTEHGKYRNIHFPCHLFSWVRRKVCSGQRSAEVQTPDLDGWEGDAGPDHRDRCETGDPPQLGGGRDGQMCQYLCGPTSTYVTIS